jgi:hypothetical protein
MITRVTVETEDTSWKKYATGRTISLAVFFIIALTIPITTLVTQQQQTTLQQAAAPPKLTSDKELVIQSLTNQMQAEMAKPHDVSSTFVARVQALAGQRKEQLLELAAVDPSLFLLKATLSSERGNYPATVQEYIEEDATVTGIFRESIGANSKSGYTLISQDGGTYTLYFVEKPTIQNEAVITVEGVRLDNVIVLPPNPLRTTIPTPIDAGPLR